MEAASTFLNRVGWSCLQQILWMKSGLVFDCQENRIMQVNGDRTELVVLEQGTLP